ERLEDLGNRRQPLCAAMHNEPVPPCREADDVEDRQLADVALLGDRMLGHERQAIRAITACLIVSLLRISIATRTSRMRSPKASCIAIHVSEPRSRTTNGSSTTRAIGTRRLPASGCDGGATITYACGANGSCTMSRPCGGRTITARSVRFSARRCRSSSRLCTVRLSVTPG